MPEYRAKPRFPPPPPNEMLKQNVGRVGLPQGVIRPYDPTVQATSTPVQDMLKKHRSPWRPRPPPPPGSGSQLALAPQSGYFDEQFPALSVRQKEPNSDVRSPATQGVGVVRVPSIPTPKPKPAAKRSSMELMPPPAEIPRPRAPFASPRLSDRGTRSPEGGKEVDDKVSRSADSSRGSSSSGGAQGRRERNKLYRRGVDVKELAKNEAEAQLNSVVDGGASSSTGSKTEPALSSKDTANVQDPVVSEQSVMDLDTTRNEGNIIIPLPPPSSPMAMRPRNEGNIVIPLPPPSSPMDMRHDQVYEQINMHPARGDYREPVLDRGAESSMLPITPTPHLHVHDSLSIPGSWKTTTLSRRMDVDSPSVEDLAQRLDNLEVNSYPHAGEPMVQVVTDDVLHRDALPRHEAVCRCCGHGVNKGNCGNIPDQDRTNARNRANQQAEPEDHRKGIEPVHRPGWQVQLASDIREFTKQLMKRPRRDSPFLPLPTQREREIFETTRRGGPSPTNFRPDVSGKNMRSPWNQECARIFANEYIQLPGAITADRRVVEGAFLTHLAALCKQYSKTNGVGIQDPDAETINVRRMRKKQLGLRRYDVMSIHPTLSANKPWINRLGIDGHSGDESDHKSKKLRFIIEPMHWRSAELTTYLRALDALHMSTRFCETGRPKKGAWPRIRVAGRKRADYEAAPITGLPRNFYDKEWLASLEDWQLSAFEIQDPVDLTLHSDVKRIVDRYKDVTGPDSYIPQHQAIDS